MLNLQGVKNNSGTVTIAAITPPHRKKAILVIWLVLGQTEDISVEYMLGVIPMEHVVESIAKQFVAFWCWTDASDFNRFSEWRV